MERVAITGGNGLIGSNLCHKLAALGYETIAMVRERSNLSGLEGFDGKIVRGEILDPKFLAQSFEGVDLVFHTAGLVSFDNRLRADLIRVNVDGTRNVMSAAKKASVKKVVHTSSVAAIGIPPAGTDYSDERYAYNKFQYNVAYADSKHLGEVEVLKAVDAGLEAVTVNPASIVGQRDVYFHFGVLLKILSGRKIVPYVPGGMCVVGVDDVVSGEIAAMKLGSTGERYILGSENLSFEELFVKIARVVGASDPNIRVPLWMMKSAASLLEILSSITGRPPVLTKAHVVSATLPHYYSFEKSERELGFERHPVDDAIRKSFEWYIGKGLMKENK